MRTNKRHSLISLGILSLIQTVIDNLQLQRTVNVKGPGMPLNRWRECERLKRVKHNKPVFFARAPNKKLFQLGNDKLFLSVCKLSRKSTPQFSPSCYNSCKGSHSSQMETSGRFLWFLQGDSFCDFLCVYLYLGSLWKRGLLMKERIFFSTRQILSCWRRPWWQGRTRLTSLHNHLHWLLTKVKVMPGRYAFASITYPC